VGALAATALTTIQTNVLTFLAVLTVVTVGVWVWSRQRARRRIFNAYLLYVALIGTAIVMAMPFYWMVVTSLKPYDEASAFPPTWWPKNFAGGENYTAAWNLGQAKPSVTFTRYFYVTILTSLITTSGALITSIFAAYAFAKMQFRGQGAFFTIMLGMMMIPGQVLLVPNYVILHQLGLLNHPAALILPFLTSMFAVFLLRQFMVGIPNDLWDAAQIDGAGRMRFLWTVMVPLCIPAIITAGLFLFLGNWNSLLWPMIVIKSPEWRTIQTGLQAFDSGGGMDIHWLMAASTIVVLPIVVIFLLAQRHFIQGIARSGLK